MILAEQIKNLSNSVIDTINTVSSVHDLDQLRSKIFGKQSPLTELLKAIASLPVDQRPAAGQKINAFKLELQAIFQKKKHQLESDAIEDELKAQRVDVTLPTHRKKGHKHPLQQTLDDVLNILKRIGFSIAKGPDIETQFHNFEALNIPKDHPAREMHDTFYLSGEYQEYVLRTHTSPVQIRTMLEKKKPPIKILSPGKVYRCDADATHSPVFHQVEGLYVNQKVSFSELKWTLSFFLKELFGHHQKLRFRSSFFPFTEPSAEVDVACVMCQAKGCAICKQTGWLEIMGCGMVHPNVFEAVCLDNVTGFAFGMGIERIAMLRYKIPDIRLFYQNDFRFLRQF